MILEKYSKSVNLTQILEKKEQCNQEKYQLQENRLCIFSMG
jgi:hypothetical protein